MIRQAFLGRLARSGAFGRVARFERLVPSRDAYGQVTGAWHPIAGLAQVPCAVAPLTGREYRLPFAVHAEATHACTPVLPVTEVRPRDRAVIGGTTYDVVAVEVDPTGRVCVVQLRTSEV